MASRFHVWCCTSWFPRLSWMIWRKPPWCLAILLPELLHNPDYTLFATQVMLGIEVQMSESCGLSTFVVAGALESHCIFLWPPGLELGARFGNGSMQVRLISWAFWNMHECRMPTKQYERIRKRETQVQWRMTKEPKDIQRWLRIYIDL